MTLWMVLVLLLYAANITAAFLLLFVERKSISVTLGWLLVFMFLPWIGFLFYLFLGSTLKFKLFKRRFSIEGVERSYQETLDKNIQNIENKKIIFNDSSTELYRDMVELNAKNAESVYSQDNTVQLLTSAQAKYSMMFEEIKNAQESINILYFIIKGKDESGKRLISLLAQKAREGVEVRLVYDRLGFLRTTRKDFKELIDAGGMIYPFLPSRFETLLNCNYRMHRKMVIIDGQVAYTGGINIGDDYLGLDPVKTPWRDTSIRLTGSSVQAIQLRFLCDWVYLERQAGPWSRYASPVDDAKHAAMFFKSPAQKGTTGVQVLSSGPDSDRTIIKDSYVKMIVAAKKYIYIQTPYLVPDETLLTALRIAALSGVDVRVMIPGIPDKKFVYYVTQSYVEELLRCRVKVYTHEGFLHAKMFVTDDAVASVGTANFDIRSFSLNYEINTMIYSSDFACQCRDAFLNDIDHSKELTLEGYSKRGVLQRMKESFWRLLTPLT